MVAGEGLEPPILRLSSPSTLIPLWRGLVFLRPPPRRVNWYMVTPKGVEPLPIRLKF